MAKPQTLKTNKAEATVESNGAPNGVRRLTKILDERERTEYKRRHQLCVHYQYLLEALKMSLQQWQNHIRKTHDLPKEFDLNLETGEVSWEMTQMEQFISKGGK